MADSQFQQWLLDKIGVTLICMKSNFVVSVGSYTENSCWADFRSFPRLVNSQFQKGFIAKMGVERICANGKISVSVWISGENRCGL